MVIKRTVDLMEVQVAVRNDEETSVEKKTMTVHAKTKDKEIKNMIGDEFIGVVYRKPIGEKMFCMDLNDFINNAKEVN